MSIDCGAETYANVSYDAATGKKDKYTGTAGRVQAVKAKSHGNAKTKFQVGKYDAKDKAAVLIYPDADCSGFPKRFFWDDDSDNATYYNKSDIAI